MPKASDLDLELLNFLPSSIDSFIKFAVLSVVVLVLYKIYEKKRWN